MQWLQHISVHGTVLLLLGLLFSWIFAYDSIAGGLSFSTSAKNINKLFGWHPFLMTIAFGVFFSESIVAFRLWNAPRQNRKLLHALLHTAALLCAILGLTAIEVYKVTHNSAHLYSVHGTMGLLTLVFLFIQYAVSALVFGTNKFSAETKSTLMKYHKFCGTIIYTFATIALLTGFARKQSSIIPTEGQHGWSVVHTSLIAAATSIVYTAVMSVVWFQKLPADK